jgi:tripartite-type tricarboxylate transporter receptor subunit TctC
MAYATRDAAVCLLGAATLFVHAPVALAQAAAFPTRPIRLIVPFPPGGGSDALARITALKMTEQLGQQVVLDNRGGAQGNIGMAIGVKAAPDGYTLVLAYFGTVAINPFLYRDTGFDPLKDLAPVSLGSSQPQIIVVHASLPAKTLKEFAAYAKAQPDRVTYASSASGGQMVMELFRQVAGVQMTHVPYRGAGPAVIDLLAGNVNAMASSPPGVAQHVRAGKLRGLAVTGAQRIPALPEVPTSAEAGYPEVEANAWFGIVAPAGTPRPVIMRLNEAIARGLAQSDARDRLTAVGLTPSPTTPEEFGAIIRRDYERWGAVVKASGAKAE